MAFSGGCQEKTAIIVLRAGAFRRATQQRSSGTRSRATMGFRPALVVALIVLLSLASPSLGEKKMPAAMGAGTRRPRGPVLPKPAAGLRVVATSPPRWSAVVPRRRIGPRGGRHVCQACKQQGVALHP